jgi:hypothetical protein
LPSETSSDAAWAKVFPSSSAAAFMRIMLRSSIFPSSPWSARQASGKRFGTSRR